MASILAKIWARLNPKREPISLMIVGLDNSGKTSILNVLASSTNCRTPTSSSRQQTQNSADQSGDTGNDFNNALNFLKDEPMLTMSNQSGLDTNSCAALQGNNAMPTVGYNFERIQYKSLAITILDFSGKNKYRNLWQEFYTGVDAIVFVIDSSDLIRLVVVRDELENMLSHPYFATLIGDDKGVRQDRSSSPCSASSSPNMHGQHQQQQQLEQLTKSNSVLALAQKQFTISQGKLIQQPLDTVPLVNPRTQSQINHQKHHGTRASKKNADQPLVNPSSSSSSATTQKRTKVPILFLANKADLANSVSIEVIIKTLNLSLLSKDKHPWLIKATSLNQTQGIFEAFDWLIGQLSAAGNTTN